MKAYMEKIERLTKTLNELKPLKPEDQTRLDKKIRLEFNYNSNHMEGNTLTYGETELLLIFDKTTGNHDHREYEEMKAHDVAFDLIKELAQDKERELTEAWIRNLNEVLLVRPYWKEALTPDGQSTRRQIKVGDYKEFPNSVRLQNGEIFEYTSPAEVSIKMGELIEWFRSEASIRSYHPLELAAVLHYKFVCIHPFDDGNGRISRLLMNYVLLKNDLPPVIIRSSDKRNYLFALNQADTGNETAFIEYIGDQLIWSLELYIKAAKGGSIEDEDDWQKDLSILKSKLAGGANIVETVKSSETIKQFFINNIVPFATAWEEKLKLFDPLFLNRGNSLILESTIANMDTMIGAVNEFQKNESNYQKLYSTKLKLHVTFKGLRNKDNGVGMNGGEVIIEFFKNAYEISYTTSKKPINKLYSQNLTEVEMSNIINSMGSWFMKNVEDYLIKN